MADFNDRRVGGDTPQQQAALKQSKTARKVRAQFPPGTRVSSGKVEGTVVRHVPAVNAQGGHLTVRWDNGTEGRHSPISVTRVES